MKQPAQFAKQVEHDPKLPQERTSASPDTACWEPRPLAQV